MELQELAAGAGFKVTELLNPGSKAFKNLGLALELITEQEAARLIEDDPKIMRRPLLYNEQSVVVGFKPKQYAELLDS